MICYKGYIWGYRFESGSCSLGRASITFFLGGQQYSCFSGDVKCARLFVDFLEAEGVVDLYGGGESAGVG